MLGKKNAALAAALDQSVKAAALYTPQGVKKMLDEAGASGAFTFEEDTRGVEVLNFVSGNNSHFTQCLTRVLQECLGHAEVSHYRGVYPLDVLARTKNKWVGGLAQYGFAYFSDEDGEPVDDSQRHPIIVCIMKLLETRLKEIEDAVERQVKNGEIAFSDLPFYYKKGREVVFADDEGSLIAGTVQTSEIKRTWMGAVYLAVTVDVIHAVSGEMTPGFYTVPMGSYDGVRKLNELSIKEVDAATKDKLRERGKLYIRCATTPSYLSYKGQLSRSSWWANETFRADGRVMVDIASFKRVDNDQASQEVRHSGIVGARDNSEGAATSGMKYVPADADLWRTYPYVWGFSFRAKRWGKMSVADLSEIAWRSDSFDKLVLAEEEKKLVKALVEHNEGSFEDLIEGKGGGCIFLLHGPPGQGKTLTAETIAELLKRPLYAISVGELGVTPDQLEERLRVILDVATVWNAVILLDEADIYLEARDEHDIMRNAMVGVFLRLLEYHHGVLFLTTNRVRNIDTAFYSRISVALSFGEGDATKREKIWTNLLEAAGINGIDIKALAKIDINGRQIKNAIRLSQTLAKADGKSVSDETLEKVIKLMTAFDSERKTAST